MTGTRTEVLAQPRGEQGRARPRSPVVLPAVIAVEGAALAVVAGLDGSPVWRVARVLVVIAITGVAVWVTRRVGRAARGGTALGLGIVGTVVGAGVASAQAKASLGTAAVVAGIVAVTGLVLLIWGAALLVRAMPGWWRLLAIPAALALLWFVVYPVTAAVFATNRPPGALGLATPANGDRSPSPAWWGEDGRLSRQQVSTAAPAGLLSPGARSCPCGRAEVPRRRSVQRFGWAGPRQRAPLAHLPAASHRSRRCQPKRHPQRRLTRRTLKTQPRI